MNTQINKLLGSDHSELDELLTELFSAFEVGSVEQIYQRLDMFWARLAMHIRAEHLHLFPAILGAFEAEKQISRRTPSLEIVKGKISVLQEDHNFFMRELLSAIKQLRKLRENSQANTSSRLLSVREIIAELACRLETHNELEESEVYIWGDTLLNDAERANLSEKMRKELDNLPPRFGKSDKHS